MSKEFVEETITLNEKYRLYRYGKGETIMISEPRTLTVKESGDHEVVDSEGVIHMARVGWLHLKRVLKNTEGEKPLLVEKEKWDSEK